MERYQYGAPEPEKDKMTARDLCRNIAESTSAHGMPHVTKARGEWLWGDVCKRHRVQCDQAS